MLQHMMQFPLWFICESFSSEKVIGSQSNESSIPSVQSQVIEDIISVTVNTLIWEKQTNKQEARTCPKNL